MSGRVKRIAVSVEHVRGWGRRICEGIASFARGCPDWSLSMFEDGVPDKRELSRYDGFIWCVDNAWTAKKLVATGRPVIDLVNDGMYPGTVSVGADHMQCGQLAARHFITHRMSNFAFCGWEGLRFSMAREDAFVRAIRHNRYACQVYRSSKRTMTGYLEADVQRERLVLPPDEGAIRKWIKSLPKPIGIFCANDLRAWQVNEICSRGGIDVPRQVAILGADNDSVPCLFSNPTLSSVDTDTFGTGYRAAETLHAILSGGHYPANAAPVLIRPVGVESRDSTAVYPVDPPWLATALGHIRSNVAKGLTASEVAEVAGRSYVAVEKAFKQKLGTTIQKEIMASRLETAQHLLAATHRPLADIAKLSGFRSVQYLCLCFQKQFGCSPLAYRQSSAH